MDKLDPYYVFEYAWPYIHGHTFKYFQILKWKPLASICFNPFPISFGSFSPNTPVARRLYFMLGLAHVGWRHSRWNMKKIPASYQSPVVTFRHFMHRSAWWFCGFSNPWGYRSFRGSLNLVLIGHAHLDWICTCVLIRCTYVYRKWDTYDDVLMNIYIYTYIKHYTFIHTYIHTYIHPYIHTYVRTYRHTYKNAHIYIYTHILYIHTQIYTYTYIHTIYIYICIHIYTYIHTYIYIIIIYIYTHTYTHIYIHIYTYRYIHTHIYIHIYIYTFTYIHTHTYIHTYIHTHTHTYTHIYIYIHIHACILTYIHT